MARVTSSAETRRTDFAWRTFSASDQAQPQAARGQRGCDSFSEPLPFVWFIEHMKATAVEHELERGAGQSRDEDVQRSKAAAQSASLNLGARSFNS